MDGWMEGWMDVWMDGWMDEWVSRGGDICFVLNDGIGMGWDLWASVLFCWDGRGMNG